MKSRRCALVIISHDRRFLETLSRVTVWLDRGQTRRLEIGFKDFETRRDEILAEEEREQHKLDRKIVAEEHWVRYGVTARRKRNMRRMGELQALRQQRNDYRGSVGKANISVAEADKSGALVIEAKNISKSYDGRPIVTDLSTRINRADRIGIVGPNGSGKTTLLSLLTGTLAPDEGSVRLGANIEMAALEQDRDSLDPDWTLAEALTDGTRRYRHGRRADQACRGLHEGLPVLARTDPHAAARSVRRRARTADAGARAGQALESPGARRADQRSRSRNARRAGGNAAPIIPAP